MNINPKQLLSLPQLGWNNLFQQQLTLEELEHSLIARVTEHHRSGYKLVSDQGEITLPIRKSLPMMTVGDWLLLNQEHGFERLLERQSLFARKAAGSKVAEQLIAANVSTVFIVCALNDDFNLNRIERYLATANESGVEPVIVLTKADLVTDAEAKRQQVQQLDPLLIVEMINALDANQYTPLTHWCKTGSTIAFIGSSGVGKSTLVNGLLGASAQLTGGIRENDSKGRHTTTGRSMHFLPTGGVLIDTPGMRELQLFDCAEGVSGTFADIEALATQCRFSDCHHESEPGCAVTHAIETGQLEHRRLNNYLKLMREQQRNGATLAERRATYKQQTKMYKNIQTASRSRKQSS
ncbi:ribosome small subunit-dependent GTPase A [Vibrio sp. Isolate23]|uniref:ribosome small subunit-dependent GTPase A n=1 Tax=Vibrio sp. Isolate23 TaxID=2908533 RepID=UPI001EFC4C87|nr:ribosome small subunit-dependent GTPase A [Vibrio sp. Isolate23]MCG9681889.1 ribosome small subunit-dependent GTPase A [Vibrio sp. Isolate23]